MRGLIHVLPGAFASNPGRLLDAGAELMLDDITISFVKLAVGMTAFLLM